MFFPSNDPSSHNQEDTFVLELAKCIQDSPFFSELFPETDVDYSKVANGAGNQCPLCNRHFPKQSYFERHVVRNSCRRSFPCQVCGKDFKTSATLKQHLRGLHSTARPLRCVECGKSFARASSLASHRKIHSPEKAFLCLICGAGFHQKGNLKSHLFVHTREKPFVCDLCSRRFAQMSNLSQHRKTVHGGSAEVTGYRCGLCGGYFGKRYLLRSHEQKVHGLVVQTEAPRQVSPPGITTVVIPAIQTPAMAVAKARKEIPFAVLHMIDEIPLIVRVLEQGNYSILKAAESSDFRESQQGGPGLEEARKVSIAVVATVYQKINEQGKTYYAITGPVSCCQTQLADPEETNSGVLQDSLASANLYKTLTQLNDPDVAIIKAKPATQRTLRLIAPQRPKEAAGSQPSTSGVNPLKRKQASKGVNLPPPQPKRAPKQPKVITVVDDLRWWDNQNVSPQTRGPGRTNFQEIGTGPLLSPVRGTTNRKQLDDAVEVVAMEQEDPFVNLDVLDMIHVDDDMLTDLHNIQIEDSREGVFMPLF